MDSGIGGLYMCLEYFPVPSLGKKVTKTMSSVEKHIPSCDAGQFIPPLWVSVYLKRHPVGPEDI